MHIRIPYIHLRTRTHTQDVCVEKIGSAHTQNIISTTYGRRRSRMVDMKKKKHLRFDDDNVEFTIVCVWKKKRDRIIVIKKNNK